MGRQPAPMRRFALARSLPLRHRNEHFLATARLRPALPRGARSSTAVFTASGIGMAYWVAADKIDSAKTARFEPDTLDDVERGRARELPDHRLGHARVHRRTTLDEEHFGDPAEQTGQRSDTIMIAHIDPDTETGLLVSFPRDLWVEIPGQGEAKINAAFNDGPADRRRDDQAELRHPDQPLPRDRLRRLPQHRRRDRHGADLLPDAGARHPDRARHRRPPGCHRLDGAMALNYARSREYEYFDEDGDWETDGTSDLGRIRRQQYFIRSLANEAVKSGFRNPTKILDIIDKTVDNITRDPDLGFSDIRALAKTFREVDPGVVEMVTVPTTREFIDGQDAQVLIESEAAPIFDRLRSFGETSTDDDCPRAWPRPTCRVGPQRLGCRRSGARRLRRACRAPGSRSSTRPGNADRNDYDVTEVRYADGSEDLAKLHQGATSAARASSSRSTRVPDGHERRARARPRLRAGERTRRRRHRAHRPRRPRPRPVHRRIPAARHRAAGRAADPRCHSNIPAMHIAVVGAGYVGLTTAACFAHLGHDVVCADIDEERVARLNKGEVPILEQGLARARQRRARRRSGSRFVTGAANGRRRGRHRLPVRADAAGRRRRRRPLVRRGRRPRDRAGRCGREPSSSTSRPSRSARPGSCSGCSPSPASRTTTSTSRRTPSSSARARRSRTSSTRTAS